MKSKIKIKPVKIIFKMSFQKEKFYECLSKFKLKFSRKKLTMNNF